ncbi:MAG TPA: hypothetical protein VLW75_08640 [Rhizomicrobium sp.]|nr:hypothetical protein [Rhizomicrobium sp.]
MARHQLAVNQGSKRQPRLARNSDISESEIAFILESLAKLKNPKQRYFLTIVIDLLADALSERSDVSIPELLELGLAVTR